MGVLVENWIFKEFSYRFAVSSSSLERYGFINVGQSKFFSYASSKLCPLTHSLTHSLTDTVSDRGEV